MLSLLVGCTADQNVNDKRVNTLKESKVDKISINMVIKKIDGAKLTSSHKNHDKNVAYQIKINEIFKHDDINKLKNSVNNGMDMVSASGKRGKLGITPLHVASANGSNEILEYLIEFKINLNIQDNGGRTLLHTAIIGNRINTVELLLKMGADIDFKNKQGYTALDIYLINKDTLDKRIYTILNNFNAKRSNELIGLTP